MLEPLIVAVGNVKGGVGKTTLAVNFAIHQALHGRDVLLVDGDEQGTARAFTQLRAESFGAPGYTTVSLRGPEIRTQLRLLRAKYQQIIVDVGGRDTSSLRAALTVADILVVPVLPASFDVWSLEPLDDLIQEAREINPGLSVVAVLNAADAQGKDNEEAAAIICEKVGFNYFPHPIVRRRAFRNAAAAGLSVFESRPSDAKAIGELKLLINHLFGDQNDIAAIPHDYCQASLPKCKRQRQASLEVYSGCVRTDGQPARRGTVHSDADPISEEPLSSHRWSGEEERAESEQLASLCSHEGTRSRGGIMSEKRSLRDSGPCRANDENTSIPVWLHATESFYKKLNRVAKQCGLPRYEALSRGLDALLREFEIQTSPLNKAIKSPSQSEVFRRTMGQVSRRYWATVSPEEKRVRAQKSANARWNRGNPCDRREP